MAAVAPSGHSHQVGRTKVPRAQQILASGKLWKTARPSFGSIISPKEVRAGQVVVSGCQHGIHHGKTPLPCSPQTCCSGDGFMFDAPLCSHVSSKSIMLALAPQDDLTAVLKTFSPDQLLTTRRAIDALLTPDALRQANQQLSPLLRLPRSILERIVDYAVSYDHAIEESSKAPGLLEACHGLRQAASRAYYSRNTFKRKRSFREEELERWAKIRVGENRRYLGRVRLGPPLHCNNEEAESEARKLETRCCLPIGSVWCLSEVGYHTVARYVIKRHLRTGRPWYVH